jgi:hypothetical protein
MEPKQSPVPDWMNRYGLYPLLVLMTDPSLKSSAKHSEPKKLPRGEDKYPADKKVVQARDNVQKAFGALGLHVIEEQLRSRWNHDSLSLPVCRVGCAFLDQGHPASIRRRRACRTDVAS